jgi:hypothetical protein
MFWTTAEWLTYMLTSIGKVAAEGQLRNKKIGTIFLWRLYTGITTAVWYFLSALFVFPFLGFISNLPPTAQGVICIILLTEFFQPKRLYIAGGGKTVRGTDGRLYVSDPNGDYVCSGYPGERFRL